MNPSRQFEHEKRLSKLASERFYLIDASQTDERQHFVVSGSTGNFYDVHLDSKNGKLSCNCPDFVGRARQFNVECKHCLFVAARVMKLPLSSEHFTKNSRHLTAAVIERWKERLIVLTRLLSDNRNDKDHLTNDDYREQYLFLKTRFEPTNVVLSPSFMGIGADEDCPICFEILCDPNKRNVELVVCHTCTHAVHRDCCDQWLQRSQNKTCIYCRTLLPYAKN